MEAEKYDEYNEYAKYAKHCIVPSNLDSFVSKSRTFHATPPRKSYSSTKKYNDNYYETSNTKGNADSNPRKSIPLLRKELRL